MKAKTGGVLLAAVIFSTTVCSAEISWYTDFEKAKEAAGKEGKNLFVLFTGSDWCPRCTELQEEVLTQKKFLDVALNLYIFVELDYPRLKALPTDLAQQNARLAEVFNIHSYPHIRVLDEKGRLFGKLANYKGGLPDFMEEYARVQQRKKERDEKLSDGAKKSGVERAKAFDAAVKLLQEDDLLVGYDELFQRIIDADSKNEAGLNWEYKLLRIKTDTQNKQYAEALQKVDFLAKTQISNEQKQELYMEKSSVFEAKNDRAGMIAALKEAIAVDPKSETSKGIEEFIQKLQKFGIEKKE